MQIFVATYNRKISQLGLEIRPIKYVCRFSPQLALSALSSYRYECITSISVFIDVYICSFEILCKMRTFDLGPDSQPQNSGSPRYKQSYVYSRCTPLQLYVATNSFILTLADFFVTVSWIFVYHIFVNIKFA